MKCDNCRRAMEEGREVFQVDEGVVGMSGFVPLDAQVRVCSIACLKEYFSGSHGYEPAPKRTP
jgi:hypothetical protein